MSKGSTRVDAPDPFAVAEADALFNRIDQYTPLSSMVFYGPQRNQLVETLNPALQYTENQRLLSDMGLNNMALSRQADMKGGSLPSLTPHLNPGAQQEFFGLPTSLVSGNDPAISPPPVPDFIGAFNPLQGGYGGVGGGALPPPGGAGGFPAPGGMPPGGAMPTPGGSGGGGMSPLDAVALTQPFSGVGHLLGLDSIMGGDKGPRRGSLPGTEWVRGKNGKIVATGHGHWNPQLGQWVDRRGRPKKNQRPPPVGGTTAGRPYGQGIAQPATQLPGGPQGIAGAFGQPTQQPSLPPPTQSLPQQPGMMNQAKGGQGMMQPGPATPQMSTPLQAPQAQTAQGPQEQMQGMTGTAQSGGSGLFGGTVGNLFDPETFGQPGDISQLADYDIDRGRVEQSMFDRTASLLSPRFDQDQERLYQDLANRGIARDSEAGRREITNFQTNRDDTLSRLAMDSVLAGGGEQSRLFNISNQLGQARTQGLSQLFGMGQELANQDIMTQLQNANIAQANRATQFNELASLLGLNQVAQPGLQNFFAPGQVDVGGAFALNQQAQQANANNATQMKTGAMDAISNLGGAGMMMSDRRMKKNIKRIGTINGHPFYEFDYLNGEHSWGVMSDEVPHAVVKGPDGYDRVDYRRIF